MIFIGRQKQRTCGGVTRRAFLQAGGSTVLGLSWAHLHQLRAQQLNYPAGTARSVIFLWLWGGPAQLDTWDPKPAAPIEYRGPFAAIVTRTPGVRVGELFPRIAALSHRYSILRSLHTNSNDHGVAGTAGLTGTSAGGVGLNGQPLPGSVRPALGAVVARARGFGVGVPPYLVIGGRLHQGLRPIIGEGGGALGGRYDPFRLQYDAEEGVRLPALQLPENLTPERLDDRQQLLQALDEGARYLDQNRSVRVLDDYRTQAIAMLTSPDAREWFDLSRETAAMRERYGYTRFGQSCLLARRLVEHGVPFVQVNWSDHVEAEEDHGDGGWDHHYRNFQLMQDRHGPWLDQAYAALLNDLQDRGLLSSTLVVAVGEFGRTPRINDKSGRDHWEHCYSALVAGGGVQPGRVVGESDARAERPAARPLTPADLAATVQRCVGISSEQAATLGIRVEGEVIEELL
jgi:hypothetical protein